MKPYVYVLLAVSLFAMAFVAGGMMEPGETSEENAPPATEDTLPEAPEGETGEASTGTTESTVEDDTETPTSGTEGIDVDTPPGYADGADPGTPSDYTTPEGGTTETSDEAEDTSDDATETPGETAQETQDEAGQDASGDTSVEDAGSSPGPSTGDGQDTPEEEETVPGSNFQLLISDAPANISDFDYLKVTLSHARVFQNNTNSSGNNSGNETRGWEIFDLNSTIVDLTQLVGNKSLPVFNGTLQPGNYTKIELYVEYVNATVNGTQVDVKVPSGKLMICMNFTVTANNTTMFVFDIHVTLKGKGGYNLKPTILESGVVGKGLDDVVIVG